VSVATSAHDRPVPDGASVLERMLSPPESAAQPGSMADAVVASWADTTGTLADGGTARLAASCLVRPVSGDRVLVYSGAGEVRWILAVLDAPQSRTTVLAAPAGLAIEAPRVRVAAKAVHIHAEDFLTSARNRHAVEDVRTETVHTRVAQIGTDVRRASQATDEVEGTVLARAGMWISNTVKEARLHARAFLFD
jgi:hypothetical protein